MLAGGFDMDALLGTSGFGAAGSSNNMQVRLCHSNSETLFRWTPHSVMHLHTGAKDSLRRDSI